MEVVIQEGENEPEGMSGSRGAPGGGCCLFIQSLWCLETENKLQTAGC